MFSEKIKPDQINNWKCIYQTGIETEARLVQAFLQDRDITCEILSKKDSAYTVNFGDLSAIFVYVPVENSKKAEKMLDEWKKGKLYNKEDYNEGEQGFDEKDVES